MVFGSSQEVHIFNLCRWQCELKWIKGADSRKCPGKQCARSRPYLESVIRIKTSSFYIHESEMTGQTLFVMLTLFAARRDATAKRYPHVNLIYLEARIDPSTWLTIMLWRNIGRLDFQAAKVIICPMLKLQMVGVEQKMAFKLEGKKGFNSKLCPLNRMVFLRQKNPLRPIFDYLPGPFEVFLSSQKNEVKKSICQWCW